MKWWHIVLTFLVFGLLIAATVFSSQAAAAVAGDKKDYATAHKKATTVAILTGVSATVIYVTFILVLAFGDSAEKYANQQLGAFRAAGDAYRTAYLRSP